MYIYIVHTLVVFKVYYQQENKNINDLLIISKYILKYCIELIRRFDINTIVSFYLFSHARSYRMKPTIN